MLPETCDLFADAAIQAGRTRSAVAWLGAVSTLDAAEFGWKAANLCVSNAVERRVPAGFAVSRHLVARIANGGATREDRELLRTAWSTLRDDSERLPIIVRSSSSIEHTRTNSFAGLFETVRDVTTFDAFLAAIRHCHAAGHGNRVERYATLRGTVLPPDHMAVLVQRQIRANRAALIQVTRVGYLFESYEGDLADRIQGEGLPDHVLSSRHGRTNVLRSNGRPPQEFFERLREIAHDIQHFAAECDTLLECLMEIVSDEHDVYVLQLNLISEGDQLAIRAPSLVLDVTATALSADAPLLGVKGAAMKYFHDTGLFESPLWVFPPDAGVDEIAAVLPDGPETAYTVRYSHAADLGLPRSFVSGRDGVTRWVRQSRQRDWSTIVHSRIDVRSSFELLVTADAMLLEHIPGMWESDNNLDPDVIMYDGDTLRAWACRNSRVGRFISTHGLDERVIGPTPAGVLKGWAKRLMPVVERLRSDFAGALPLNFHFVADSQQRWFFLNARSGFKLETLSGAVSGNPYVVRRASDLDGWDRHLPILLRFSAERGSESRVLAIAERLMHRRGVPIFIDFGVLSHPALILRELGFTVIPSYLGSGDRLLSPSYKKSEWALDCGDDPIARIRDEAYLYRDGQLRIVQDREPIVPGHLLLVAERPVRSFADAGVGDSLDAVLHAEISPLPRRWLFYERGRARFCTSGFTNVHAHGHLLPIEYFKANVTQTLAADLAATRFDNLESALQVARASAEEYALVLSSDGDVFLRLLADGASLQKRRIRRLLARNVL